MRFVAVLVTVALIAMGGAVASARGQTMTGGRVAVLCAGGGIVQITLDAEGRPTGESHLCPDLAAALLAAFRLDTPVVARPEGLAETLVPLPARFCVLASCTASRARGPPLSA